MTEFVVAAFFGALIWKNLDEGDSYVEPQRYKPREVHRDMVGFENQIQKSDKKLVKTEYTPLGIPMQYYQLPNGSTIRVYGPNPKFNQI